jgi:hypothetical protein
MVQALADELIRVVDDAASQLRTVRRSQPRSENPGFGPSRKSSDI